MIAPLPESPSRSGESVPVGYRRLAELLGVLLAEQQVAAVLERIAETLRQLVSCDDIVIWEAVSPDRLRPAFVEGGDADQLRRLEIRLGEGITGHACLTQQPICSNRAHLDERAGHVPGTPVEPEAITCLPLVARLELLGALSLYRSGLDGFTDSEFELIQRFAAVAALALANAKTQASLEELARTDELTTLANRRELNEQLARELARARQHRKPLSLLLLDLDDFKRINDSNGHHAGDDALREIAHVLVDSLRDCDLAARLGGDEFALLLPNTSIEQARTVARRIAEAIQERTGVHVSTGVATETWPARTDMLRAADRDLYRSKRDRRPGGRRLEDLVGRVDAEFIS